MKGFFHKLDAIDSIIREGSSPENALRLVALMDDAAASLYAFQHLDASWLAPLESSGYFRDYDTDGVATTSKPMWAATAYLKQIASAAGTNSDLAQGIQRVVAFMPAPQDIRATRDIIDIAVVLPRENRRGLVPVIQRSINKFHDIEFAQVTKLLFILAEEGESAATVRLFSSVFAVAPAKAHESTGPHDTFLPAEPVALMDSWNYGQELNKCHPNLTRALGLPILRCLVGILADHLRFSSREPTFQGPDDYSYIWRPAIEGHEQNIREDVRDYIVSAIRDCAVAIAEKQPSAFTEIINLLDEQQWFIFTRILLYLIAVSPSSPIVLIGYFAAQPSLFSEIAVRHEYSMLLRLRFKVLPLEQQQVVLKMIESGPDLIAYRNAAKFATGQAASNEDTAKFSRRWRFDWLSFIEHDLPQDAKAQYEDLRNEFGSPENPEFPYYMRSGLGRTGQVLNSSADIAADEDLTMDQVFDQAVALSVVPNEGDPDRKHVLLQKLRDFALEDPLWVGEHSGVLRRLPPSWIASVTSSALGAPGDISPAAMLALLQLASAASEGLQGAAAPEAARELKDSLVNILEQVLRSDMRVIGFEHLPVLQLIAQRLLSAVQLHGTRVQTDGADFDPMTSSINATDGRLVDVCLKLAAAEHKLRGDSASPAQWFFEAVSRMLSEMPNDETEISAILGSEFPLIVHLAPVWAVQNAGSVFPKGQKRKLRWAAAWGSYITYARAFTIVFDILEPQYTYAVQQLTRKLPYRKSRMDMGQGLAQHLSVFFWFDKIQIQDGVLRAFFAHAKADNVRSFLWSLGRGMKEVPEFSQDLGNRLVNLADWLIYTWNPRQKEATGGLSSLGWWFPQQRLAEPEWQLRILVGAARRAGRLDNPDEVLTALGKWATQYPSLAIGCLLALVEGSPNDSTRYYLSSHSESILHAALLTADADTKEQIATIADYFGAQGSFEYREVYRNAISNAPSSR